MNSKVKSIDRNDDGLMMKSIFSTEKNSKDICIFIISTIYYYI